jgi:hypothetical protein
MDISSLLQDEESQYLKQTKSRILGLQRLEQALAKLTTSPCPPIKSLKLQHALTLSNTLRNAGLPETAALETEFRTNVDQYQAAQVQVLVKFKRLEIQVAKSSFSTAATAFQDLVFFVLAPLYHSHDGVPPLNQIVRWHIDAYRAKATTLPQHPHPDNQALVESVVKYLIRIENEIVSTQNDIHTQHTVIQQLRQFRRARVDAADTIMEEKTTAELINDVIDRKLAPIKKLLNSRAGRSPRTPAPVQRPTSKRTNAPRHTATAPPRQKPAQQQSSTSTMKSPRPHTRGKVVDVGNAKRNVGKQNVLAKKNNMPKKIRDAKRD